MSGTQTPERTANEVYLDAVLRHQIDIRRYTLGEIQRIRVLLEAADRDLVAQLREMLSSFDLPAGRDDFTIQRIRALLADVRAARAATMEALRTGVEERLTQLAPLEGRHEEDVLLASIPVQLELATVRLAQLRAVVKRGAFEGQLLSQWFSQLAAQDQQRLERALAIGMTNGETLEQILRRVVGTRAGAYQDGILSISRRNAEAIVRTAINQVSNDARSEVWDANSDIITGERWTATLDGRTSAICRARDGQVFPLGEGPRPPAHFNCRSVMVAVLSGVAIVGDRPYVVDTRRPGDRRVDFEEEAKTDAGSAWKDMTPAERRAAVRRVRDEWARKNIGQVPAATTYQDWLRGQSAAFQDKVLGQRKGKLFREGGLRLDQFVDRAGTELNLSQLKALYPDAWARSI